MKNLMIKLIKYTNNITDFLVPVFLILLTVVLIIALVVSIVIIPIAIHLQEDVLWGYLLWPLIWMLYCNEERY